MISNCHPLSLRWLPLLLACALPFCSEAKSSEATDDTIDLSIIQHSDVLRPHMSMQERLALLEAEKMIKVGGSEIRNGTYLIQKKASSLYPNEDMKPNKLRGKKLIEDGHAKIAQGQRAMVELLTSTEHELVMLKATASQRFNFSPTQQDYATALEAAATTILQNCEDAGYENIFFDGLQVIKADQLESAGLQLRNNAYDTFIAVDGTRFSVKLAMGLKLTQDDSISGYTFSHDSSAVFKGQASALLAIEIIAPSHQTKGLLSVRAFDLQTQQLLASSATYLSDVDEILSETDTDTETEATVAADSSETVPPMPAEVLITNDNQMIDNLEAVAMPYIFEITTSNIQDPAQALVLKALMGDSILKNSKLILVDGDFMKRSYVDGDFMKRTDVASDALVAESEKGPATATLNIIPLDDWTLAPPPALTATATLNIIPLDDEAGTYAITAHANNSAHVLEVGTMTLQSMDSITK
jgi:hypothetical protein